MKEAYLKKLHSLVRKLEYRDDKGHWNIKQGLTPTQRASYKLYKKTIAKLVASSKKK